MLVLADANLDVAASAAVWGSYTNCGQFAFGGASFRRAVRKR